METVLAVISVAALICSAAALVFGAAALTRLKRVEADREEVRQLRLVREMRRRTHALRDNLIENPEDGAKRGAYERAAADLAAAYETVCARYLDGKTDPSWFAAMYGRELISWAEQGPMRSRFARRSGEYPLTARVYREMRRRLS